MYKFDEFGCMLLEIGIWTDRQTDKLIAMLSLLCSARVE